MRPKFVAVVVAVDAEVEGDDEDEDEEPSDCPVAVAVAVEETTALAVGGVWFITADSQWGAPSTQMDG